MWALKEIDNVLLLNVFDVRTNGVCRFKYLTIKFCIWQIKMNDHITKSNSSEIEKRFNSILRAIHIKSIEWREKKKRETHQFIERDITFILITTWFFHSIAIPFWKYFMNSIQLNNMKTRKIFAINPIDLQIVYCSVWNCEIIMSIFPLISTTTQTTKCVL